MKNYPISRITEDLASVEGMAKKLDTECEITENPIYEFSFDSEKRKFDTLLLYLRRVHAFDYWTSTSFEN